MKRRKVEAWAVVDEDGFVHDAWSREADAEDAARHITVNSKTDAKVVHLAEGKPAVAEMRRLRALVRLQDAALREALGFTPYLTLVRGNVGKAIAAAAVAHAGRKGRGR